MNDTPARAESDRDIFASRRFSAPREAVFAAWSDPVGISNWWGPRGFSTTTHEMEFRTGGAWRFTMHGPDGIDYPNQVVYTEIIPARRIAYRHAGGDGYHDVRFSVVVAFTDEAGKTRMDFRMTFESAKMRDDIAIRYGAIEGLRDTVARLDEHLSKQ